MIISSIQKSAKQIAKMVSNGNLSFDNAVQRGFVWDKQRQTKFIDTMLRNYPIPAIYSIKGEPVLNEKGKEVCTYDCIDGKQRCTTIYQFVNDEFALGKMEMVAYDNGDEIDVSGYKFSDLDPELQDRILDRTLTLYFFMDITDEEICEMMARLNNGKTLSSYEFSRIKAKDLPGIQEVTQNALFENISNKGYNREDIVVKSYAMLYTTDTCLDMKCIRPLIETVEFDEDIKEVLNNCFNYIAAAKDTILGYDDDVKLNKQIINKILKKTHLVSIVPIAYKAIEDEIEVDIFAKFLQDFFSGDPSKSDVYNEACKNGCGHTANVDARTQALLEELENFEA